MKKAKIFSVAMVPQAGQYLVSLEELGGTRLIPIWIGPAEGMAITAALQKETFPRPLTHDLLINITKELEAKIEKVIITDLKDDIFYANILVRAGDRSLEIDSRPSDAMAVAAKNGVPIYIEERVFEKCPEIHKPITKEEVNKFKENLGNMRPEDFFRKKRNG